MNSLWVRQCLGIVRLELRKTLWSARALPLYFLTFVPIGLMALFVIVQTIFGDADDFSLSSASLFYAGLYQAILRFFLYLGCVWIFMNLFRGEVLDRSLHYYFLAPIRREVLVTGKFLSGLVTVWLFFTICTVGCKLLLYSYYGPSAAAGYLLGSPGLGRMLAYISVTLLACLGYGAVFLVVGLFLRNPIVPAALIWLWEGINPFLPSLLKKFSVIFYLDSLLPVRLPEGPFAVMADPVPVWMAVIGFLLFTAATLVVAAFSIRRMEIAYAAE